jgi:hypothetical protein
MRLASPGELAALWAGPASRTSRPASFVVDASYADFEDYWAPFLEGTAPSGAYCARSTTRAARR